MINWMALLLRARKGALPFPLRLRGHGVVAGPDELVRQADPAARLKLETLDARAAFLAQDQGGKPDSWIDVVDVDAQVWDCVERTIHARRAEPARAFHVGRLADTVDDPRLLPQVLALLTTIARMGNDPGLYPGPDARRVHVHGPLPGLKLPFGGRWAAEPGDLGGLEPAPGEEPTIGVLPSWQAFLHANPHSGVALLWPDHGPWSLRRLDWLFDAHTHVWVATRADLEGAARLRAAFGRVHIHLPALPALARTPSIPRPRGLLPAEQAWWDARGTGDLADLPAPPGFVQACLVASP